VSRTRMEAQPDLVEEARSLAPAILAARDEIEQQRCLPLGLFETMARTGIFRMTMPRDLGGSAVDPVTMFRVIEEVSVADGSAGWFVMVASQHNKLAAYLEDLDVARAISASPSFFAAGKPFTPEGRAKAVEGGYRVSGNFPFGSGCGRADWIAVACRIFDGDAMRIGADGLPANRTMFIPAAACEILDTWSVSGLRGSGSHEIVVNDVFVPGDHSISRTTIPAHGATAARMMPTFPMAVAAVATGVARCAIDALMELAGAKKPQGTPGKLLRERVTVQMQVAQAEATLGAARAYVLDEASEWWGASPAEEVSRRTRLRLASIYAVESATRAVDLMYAAGGGTSIYTSSLLERAFRDVHTITQHSVAAATGYETVGRAMLGLEVPTPFA